MPRWAASADFYVGLVAGLFAAAVTAASASFRENVVTILIGEAAAAAAILAVVLTALAIVVGMLDDFLITIIDRVRGGVQGLMWHYQFVAKLAGVATIAALGGLFVAPLEWEVVNGLIVGLATGATAWAAWGTVQLVSTTALIGVRRADMTRMIVDSGATREQVLTALRQVKKSA
jgi:type IV secretory pathway VirB2 component (pilin)